MRDKRKKAFRALDMLWWQKDHPDASHAPASERSGASVMGEGGDEKGAHVIDHSKTTTEKIVVNEATGETKDIIKHVLKKIDSVHAPVYKNRRWIMVHAL